MRLSDYLIHPICTSTEPSGQYNLQLEAYKMAVKLMNGMAQPTVCDIDAIRAEISDLKPYAMYTDGMVKKSEILQIIDRHMKGDKE